MKEPTIRLVVGIAIVSAVIFTVGLLQSKPATQVTPTTEDTYMGLTRQIYLDKVSNNGQDTASLCVYTYLLDKYGIKETYKMDYRATVDENDVDQKILDEIKHCQDA